MSSYKINPKQPTAIVVHGLHKTGTMFLYQLFQRLSKTRKIGFYSENNSPPNKHLAFQKPTEDFCLCPVRDYADTVGLPENYDVKRIFHVRDPRDILVSQYFSFGWRHTHQGLPDNVQRFRDFVRRNTIDEYVLHENAVVPPLKEMFADLINRPPQELEHVVYYEEMVLSFPKYLSKVVAAFNFPFPSLPIARYATRYRNEFKPDKANDGHKRSVLPGDHVRKLRPETIAKLNEIFAPELKALNYPMDVTQNSELQCEAVGG